MSKLYDDSISIYDAIQNVKYGKYVMPAFQRQYVWSMEQIEKLWDSILLDYPIATFLFWHVDDSNVTWDTYFCSFLTKVIFDSRKQADSKNYELITINVKQSDTAVLDGQQRLTSLYLSLLGEAMMRPKHGRKSNDNGVFYTKLLIELNKNKIVVEEGEYNTKKYDIRFTEKFEKISPTQFEIRDILDNKFRDMMSRKQAIDETIDKVPYDSKEYARDILNKLCEKVHLDKLIRFTKIHDMKQDDALEMFVRFNSGGKSLKKSEITMSILEAYWPSARTEFGKLLTDSYNNFDSDFIIRTALMLYGDVVKSNVSKQIADDLKNNWKDFKQSLKNLDKGLSSLKISVNHFSNSWNVLLPVIYFIYFNPEYINNLKNIRSYIIRAVLFTYFQSGTTGKLQQMKNAITQNNFLITTDMLEQISDLRVTDGKLEDVLNSEKGSRVATEALYYLSLEWRNINFKYEQDHLHPDNRLISSKPINVDMNDWVNWRSNRNKLPNLQLLEGRMNASKSDMRLIDFYNDMNEEQKNKFHLEAIIPTNVSLDIENFGNLYDKRKEMLTERLNKLMGK